LSLLLVITGCAGIVTGQEATGETPQKSGFNFIFKYGVTGRNTLDTFQGTFTKDMIMDAAITIDLTLTAEEMDSVYQKMLGIDLFSYPDKFSVHVADNPNHIGGYVSSDLGNIAADPQFLMSQSCRYEEGL
jgi:hypothetical protein